MFFPYLKYASERGEKLKYVQNTYLGQWKLEHEEEGFQEALDDYSAQCGIGRLVQKKKKKRNHKKKFSIRFWKKKKAVKEQPSNAETEFEFGISQSTIPSGLSSVPFRFDQRAIGGGVHDMRFLGGLACATQAPDVGIIEPQFGMAVVEELADDDHGK